MNDSTEYLVKNPHYSPAFKLVSIIAGLFTVVITLGYGSLSIADDPVGTAEMGATAVFTVSAIGVLAAAILATLVMRNTKPAPAPAGTPATEPELVA